LSFLIPDTLLERFDHRVAPSLGTSRVARSIRRTSHFIRTERSKILNANCYRLFSVDPGIVACAKLNARNKKREGKSTVLGQHDSLSVVKKPAETTAGAKHLQLSQKF
jgi:hypothetical protein